DLTGSVTFPRRGSAMPKLGDATYDLRGSVRGVDMARVTPLIARGALDLSGLLDVDGSIRGTLRAPSGHAAFALHGGQFGKVPIDELHGTIDTDGRSFALHDATVDFPFAQMTGEGVYGPDQRLAAAISIDASDLAALAKLFDRPSFVTGSAQGAVTVSGTTHAPTVIATLLGGRGAALGVGFDQLTGRVVYSPGEVDIADAQIALDGGRGVVTIGGTLPLQLSPFGLGPKNRPIALDISANAVDLAALDPLTSRFLTMTGSIDASATMNGTAGHPQVSGTARLRGAGVESRYEAVPAQNINADLTFASDTLTLDRLNGQLGKGSFSGTGAVHIVPAEGLLNVAGLQYWLHTDLRGAQIDVPGWSAGDLNGTLRVTKSGTIPFLSGDVTLDNGDIPFSAIYALASGFGSGPSPSNGPLPGVPALEPGHIVVYGGGVFGGGGPYTLSAAPGTAPTPSPRTLPAIDLSVAARAGRNLRVHGGSIDLTATGSVVVGGNLQAPTIDGTFTSTRGEVGYFDTNFRLVRGSVTFDPVEGLLPTLDVQAVTNLSGVEITLTVTGRVDNLQTDLSSNPSMSRDDIVATLLHEPQVQSVISATPTQAQSQLYAEAETYFNAQLSRSLLFPVESLIAQTIDVEQIALITDAQGNVNVEVRKLITPTVYGIYRSTFNVPVTQTVGVAYSLRDYADLEILQTESPSGLQQSVLNLRLTFH
ncbi:MAG TPA: translocation/assembly module TamB domain-containing protein, partial [Candidatus Eremiobacteraceae bacterium]|nr:translocation/assembly module TamB domain-containing protein [Candidatus Eremiobacteraceae bacterium]